MPLAQAPRLTRAKRQLLLARLRSQVHNEGILHIVSSVTRSQYDNRADTIIRFQTLLRRALHRPRHRIATRPGRAAAERRLQAKRQHLSLIHI